MISGAGLLSVRNVSKNKLLSFFKRTLASTGKELKLSGNPLGMLVFFEASTRTRVSFEAAGLVQGLKWLHLNPENMSLIKGESLRDTFKVLKANRPGLVVVRHSSSGFAHLAQKWLDCAVINAGDGQNEHPTQGLLDAYTLWKEKPSKKWKIAFYGDVARSRVARSDLFLFKALGYQVFVTNDKNPDTQLFAKAFKLKMISKSQLVKMDAVQVLRVQKERGSFAVLPPLEPKVLGRKTLVMHPGPVIWGQDISSEFLELDPDRTLIHKQVENGFLIRRQIIQDILKGEKK